MYVCKYIMWTTTADNNKHHCKATKTQSASLVSKESLPKPKLSVPHAVCIQTTLIPTHDSCSSPQLYSTTDLPPEEPGRSAQTV